MRARLNITNGDSAAEKMRAAGVTGDTIAWRDVLHEGPVDASLPLEKLSQQRAKFIAERGWDDFAHVSGDFAERDKTLNNLDQFDEIVLWFEDDLYDQLQLLQLLDFFAGHGGARDTLSLVQVDGYIPPLPPAAILQRESERAAVTAAQLQLGARAWKAFGSADPAAIMKIVGGDTAVLRFLASAMTRLMQEYPWSETGLSRTEAEALRAIEAGHATPVAAFLEISRKEDSIFLGDIVFYWYLERLSDSDTPLVTWTDGTRVVAPNPLDARVFTAGELVVTDAGRDVLAGRKDWQRINRNSRWLGGVQIKPGKSGWRWDPPSRQLVRQDR